jgi:hypothetical protein
MRTHLGIAASALFLGLAGPAQAAQLLSGALPTAVGSSGACYVRNTGTTKVTLQVKLFSNNGIVAAQYHDFCSGPPLAGGHTCVVLVDDLPDDSYVACSVTGNTGKVRGTLEVRETSPTLRVLVSDELR